jgi:hypothetical protein
MVVPDHSGGDQRCRLLHIGRTEPPGCWCVRVLITPPHAVPVAGARLLLEPIHFVMEGGMLIVIKRRAEHPATGSLTTAGDPSPRTSVLTHATSRARSSTPGADRRLA